jgi:EAL domain-containing protein (putative c-di-GMP-specific phosphodiesterase class I)
VLKIDQVFVAGLDGEQAAVDLVESMVGMARALGLEVVAEGIERSGQLSALQGLGVGRGQGYLFARPLEAARVLESLRPKVGRRDRMAVAHEGSLTAA